MNGVGLLNPFLINIKMKKFSIIIIIVAFALVGYSMFYLGLVFFKAIIGLGVLALIVLGMFIGYVVGNVTKKKS